jgi:hypothetical protein
MVPAQPGLCSLSAVFYGEIAEISGKMRGEEP